MGRTHQIQKTNSDRRLRMMMGAHLFWVFLVCLLGAWWGRLLMTQAAHIAALESNLDPWHHTQRMLYWESPVFFGLLLGCSGLIFWLYWADVKRARSLQAFFASVTHELRTPLTSIRLQAESIAENLSAENLNSDHTQKDLLKRLLEDTIRLEAQVERTLELARIEGGGPVYTQTVQLKPWLNRFIKSWELDYSNRVSFVQNVEDILIEADPTALQIIFKNLFENSVKHSGKDKVQISIKTLQSNSILISDNGCGYTGEPRDLGELFKRGPLSQGTGVGLYLAKVLMKQMKGSVQFQIKPQFEIRLTFKEGSTHE